MQPNMPSDQQKALGAYYTDQAVASFLANWAIRDSSVRVLEPSFGGGAFLGSAVARLNALGGRSFNQVYGCELDQETYSNFLNGSGTELGLDGSKLFVGNFFDLVPPDQRFDVVLGNPPFVRYQTFSGAERKRALQCARQAGVILSELSSSWAPFIVHATRFLIAGGRLAMVAPHELLHASYAAPVLRHLRASFRQTRLLTFDKRLFPGLSQDTLLILADGYGQRSEGVSVSYLRSAEDLPADGRLEWVPAVDITAPLDEPEGFRATLFRLPPVARALYTRLVQDARVLKLGQVATVGIGYVTGANEYFHLSSADLEHWQIDKGDVLPAIRRGRDLSATGLALTVDDWMQLERAGKQHWLFHPQTAFPKGVADYIAHGEQLEIHKGYKCRTRRPWWRVPWVIRPDLLLTVMSGTGPRLVANEAQAVVTNSLHTVILLQPAQPKLLSAASLTTLTQLSAEIEGHALGGGMLKLEPSEASRLLLPCGIDLPPSSELLELDRLVRAGAATEAMHAADNIFLRAYLGIQDHEVSILQDALMSLRTWRKQR